MRTLTPHLTHSLQNTYVYSLAPPTPTAITALSSDDILRTFTRDTLALISTIPNTHDGATCLTTVDTNILATGGRDGAVRLWDIRDGKKVQELRLGGGGGGGVLSVAACAGGVAAGGELVGSEARVAVWDTRTSGIKAQYTESHNDDITNLAFHPTTPHLLLSAATDGLVNVYNLLSPPAAAGNTDDEEALWQVVNHGGPVHRAGWLGAGENMWAVSCDEKMGVYGLVTDVDREEDVREKRWGDVRGLLGCEYVVDVVGGVVGAGNLEGMWVDMVRIGEGWEFEEGVRLQGGHGGEVCRCVWVDEEAGMVYTGGEDGLVKVWRGGNEVGAGAGATAVADALAEKAERKRAKEERRERKERKETRYKPY